jgi:threonine/homoserine efflux transporter RhtA
MALKEKLYIAALVVMGLVGLYLVLTSGRIQIDPYSVILALLVGVFALYFYLISRRD